MRDAGAECRRAALAADVPAKMFSHLKDRAVFAFPIDHGPAVAKRGLNDLLKARRLIGDIIKA